MNLEKNLSLLSKEEVLAERKSYIQEIYGFLNSSYEYQRISDLEGCSKFIVELIYSH